MSSLAWWRLRTVSNGLTSWRTLSAPISFIADGHLSSSDLKPSGRVSKRASSSEGSGCDDCHRFDSGSYLACRKRTVCLGSSDYNFVPLASKKPTPRALPIDLVTHWRPIGIVTLKGRTVIPTTQRFIECARDVAKSFSNWSCIVRWLRQGLVSLLRPAPGPSATFVRSWRQTEYRAWPQQIVTLEFGRPSFYTASVESECGAVVLG